MTVNKKIKLVAISVLGLSFAACSDSAQQKQDAFNAHVLAGLQAAQAGVVAVNTTMCMNPAAMATLIPTAKGVTDAQKLAAVTAACALALASQPVITKALADPVPSEVVNPVK